MNFKLTTDSEILRNSWLIRPCQIYKDEYKSCRRIKARFHQHFIYGASLNCSQWHQDYNNCLKWEETNSLKAAEELCRSELERRAARLIGHARNNVWERRKSPPEDWNKPLPEEIQKEYKNSFLDIKAKELNGEVEPTIASDVMNRCSIL